MEKDFENAYYHGLAGFIVVYNPQTIVKTALEQLTQIYKNYNNEIKKQDTTTSHQEDSKKIDETIKKMQELFNVQNLAKVKKEIPIWDSTIDSENVLFTHTLPPKV